MDVHTSKLKSKSRSNFIPLPFSLSLARAAFGGLWPESNLVIIWTFDIPSVLFPSVETIRIPTECIAFASSYLQRSCFQVLRGWLTRRKNARLREVHQLQLAFIRKFSDDIASKGQFYRTQMDYQCQYDQQRRVKPIYSSKIDEDDEQVEKTLNFFDAMLDPYLDDHEINDENQSRFHLNEGHFDWESARHFRSTTFHGCSASQIHQSIECQYSSTHETRLRCKSSKQASCLTHPSISLQGNISTNTNTLSSTSSSSSSQKNLQRPNDLHASHFHQFQNIRCRFEQMTSGTNNAGSNNVRRYTSENNLNAIHGPSKPALPEKSTRPPMAHSNATSTEDLTKIPSWKKLSPQARLSALLDKTNHPPLSASSSLTASGTSASLIDLSSIDKIPINQQVQPTARPRFRFVPPSDKNSVLKEEPEPEQQTTPSYQPYDNVDRRALANNRLPLNSAPQAQASAVPQNKHPSKLFVFVFRCIIVLRFSFYNRRPRQTRRDIATTICTGHSLHCLCSSITFGHQHSASEWQQCIQTTCESTG